MIRIVERIFFSLLFAVLVYGQGGSISGTISDPTGAAVANAKVVVKSLANGAQRDALAAASGGYQITGLAPGAYRVEVEAAGFQKVLQNALQLQVDERLRLDFQLKLAKCHNRSKFPRRSRRSIPKTPFCAMSLMRAA